MYSLLNTNETGARWSTKLQSYNNKILQAIGHNLPACNKLQKRHKNNQKKLNVKVCFRPILIKYQIRISLTMQRREAINLKIK